jgi:hypothetical protein
MAPTLEERMVSIETEIKELGKQIESLVDELRTVKLTIEGNAEIKGDLTVGGTISGVLAAGTVGNAQIVAQAITADKIKNAEIGSNLLADNAVTSAKIADGQIGTAKLANDAVTTGQIKPEAVGKDRLAGEVQVFLNTYFTSIVDTLKPDANNDWPLGVTLPSGTYFVLKSESGDAKVNNFDVKNVVVKAGSKKIQFDAVGGSPGKARLNLLIARL